MHPNPSRASRTIRAVAIVGLATLAFAVGVFLGARGDVAARATGDVAEPNRPPVVTPASASPSPSGSPSAEPGPSDEPEPEPSEPPRDGPPIRVELDVSTPHHVSVDVVDHPGVVIDARSGPVSDGVSIDYGDLRVENLDDHTLQLTWSDRPGDNALALYVWRHGETVRLVLVQPPHDENGDAILIDRSLIVELEEPVSAEGLDTVLVEMLDAPGR